jgi:RNA polymerase sigma factor (sigma-70 family)
VAATVLDVDRLYRDHGHVVLRRAQRILGDPSEARELVQEVFMSLVAKPKQFRGDSSVTTFLYAMTTNACLNRLRAAHRRKAFVERHSQSSAEASSPGAGDTIIAADVLSRLPERLARVAICYFIDEMTHAEIAAAIGISRRHVGNLVDEVVVQARRAVEEA